MCVYVCVCVYVLVCVCVFREALCFSLFKQQIKCYS